MALLILASTFDSIPRQPVRVLIVDDSEDFVVWASRFLCLDVAIEIVGTASSGCEALERVCLLHPHIVLMDVNLPGMSGLQATQQIKALANAPYVIISTLCDTKEYRNAAHTASADGFVPKSEFGTEILPLIHKLCDHRIEVKQDQ